MKNFQKQMELESAVFVKNNNESKDKWPGGGPQDIDGVRCGKA